MTTGGAARQIRPPWPSHSTRRTSTSAPLPATSSQGELDEKAWDRYLKSLPDVSEKAAQVETVMADSDDFLDDEIDEE